MTFKYEVPLVEVRVYDKKGIEKTNVSPLRDIISLGVTNSIQPEADSFSIGISNKYGKYTNKIIAGDQVKISLGWRKPIPVRLRGIIDSISFILDSSGEKMSIEGRDHTALLTHRIINKRYENKAVSKIITATQSADAYRGIIEEADLQNDITVNNVEITDYAITIDFKNKSVLICLKELVDAMLSRGTGEKWAFYLDIDKDLHFYKVESATTSPEEIRVDENMLTCSITKDIYRLINKVKVRGAYEINKKVDNFNVAEGETQYAFVLTYGNVDRLIHLKVDTVEKEEGVDFTTNHLGGTIFYSTGVTGGTGGSTVEVSYLYKKRMETTDGWLEDSQSQTLYGVKERVVDTAISDQSAIDNLSSTILNYYKDLKDLGRVRVVNVQTINIGDLVKIYYSDIGLNGDTFKVVSMGHSYTSSGGYSIELTLEELVPDLIVLLRSMYSVQSDLTTRMP